MKDIGVKNCCVQQQQKNICPFRFFIKDSIIESKVSVLFIRYILFVGWALSIIYATYEVWAACETYLPKYYKDPLSNPSMLSSLFKRGKDSTDMEWEFFSFIYVKRLWIWQISYIILSITLQPVLSHRWSIISIGLTLSMLSELVGMLPTMAMIIQVLVYWLVAKINRSRSVVWGVTLFFIYILNSPWSKLFLPKNVISHYFFVITFSWNLSRSASFCFDVSTAGDDHVGIDQLRNMLYFCFYFPLSFGPLTTYENFHKNLIRRDLRCRRNRISDVVALVKNLARAFLLAMLNEFLLHHLYFRALSMMITVHNKLSLWAICGTMYWLGQFFALKYKVVYGIPTAIALFDGMEMPKLPACPSRIHRFSVLWREFDPGLYTFIILYIYVPALRALGKIDRLKKIPHLLKKLMASLLSFAFVLVWHSLSFEVFLWSVFNFVGVAFETTGSYIKQKIDAWMPVQPFYWDFLIEPVVTVPLAAMSILNSSIFCGSLDAALSFIEILWKRRLENWTPIILYCATFTAVSIRAMRQG